MKPQSRVPLTSDLHGRSFREINKVRRSLLRTMTFIMEASHQVAVLNQSSRSSRDGTEVEKEGRV